MSADKKLHSIEQSRKHPNQPVRRKRYLKGVSALRLKGNKKTLHGSKQPRPTGQVCYSPETRVAIVCPKLQKQLLLVVEDNCSKHNPASRPKTIEWNRVGNKQRRQFFLFKTTANVVFVTPTRPNMRKIAKDHKAP